MTWYRFCFAQQIKSWTSLYVFLLANPLCLERKFAQNLFHALLALQMFRHYSHDSSFMHCKAVSGGNIVESEVFKCLKIEGCELVKVARVRQQHVNHESDESKLHQNFAWYLFRYRRSCMLGKFVTLWFLMLIVDCTLFAWKINLTIHTLYLIGLFPIFGHGWLARSDQAI